MANELAKPDDSEGMGLAEAAAKAAAQIDVQGEGPSPLAEASPQSLDELFARDPQKLSEQDIETIVAKLRLARARFQQSEIEKDQKPAKKRTPKKSVADQMRAPIEEVGALTLEDLELED